MNKQIKERGIIFNGEMVRAILDGRKTQTRRILSPRQLKIIDTASSIGECYPLDCGIQHENSQSYYRECCPFGQVGDRLWVRETFTGHYLDDDQIQDIKDGRDRAIDLCEYRADYPNGSEAAEGWTPSSQMPRWASRITLEITDIRVERLQEITLGDICKEVGCGLYDFQPATHGFSVWEENWKSIYGQDSWQSNPWVWVVEFKRVEAA